MHQFVLLALLLCFALPVHAADTDPSGANSVELVDLALKSSDYEPLKAVGEAALPVLLSKYEHANEEQRTRIANALYYLSIPSEPARELLMQDIHSQNERLRLAVQWALGRVSSDDQVVATLLEKMQHDPNPLFRDKAACALASDQIHLTEKQAVKLYEGLIRALEDPKLDVRRIAHLALQIRSGQTMGFTYNAAWRSRKTQIVSWQRWLNEYRRNVE